MLDGEPVGEWHGRQPGKERVASHSHRSACTPSSLAFNQTGCQLFLTSRYFEYYPHQEENSNLQDWRFGHSGPVLLTAVLASHQMNFSANDRVMYVRTWRRIGGHVIFDQCKQWIPLKASIHGFYILQLYNDSFFLINSSRESSSQIRLISSFHTLRGIIAHTKVDVYHPDSKERCE